MRYVFIGLLLFCASAPLPQAAFAAAEQSESAGPSGLPLPRFVTLKSNHANMRVGPDQNKYPVTWVYQRRGLPVEIIQEYGNWRRIRDYDGAAGWVNAALLSGRRGALIAPGQKGGLVPLYAEPNSGSAVVMRAEPGVIGAIRSCDGAWCALEIEKMKACIPQSLLWGVYPGEVIQ